MGRSTDPQLKLKVLAAVDAGESVHDTAKKFGVASPTIYAWIAKRREKGLGLPSYTAPPMSDSESAKRVKVLEAEVRYLREILAAHNIKLP